LSRVWLGLWVVGAVDFVKRDGPEDTRENGMNESGKAKILALLFGNERQLENIRFIPGTGRGLTADQMCSEAAQALQSALSKGPADNPPMSGRVASALE
jgi:hypothetical protein